MRNHPEGFSNDFEEKKWVALNNISLIITHINRSWWFSIDPESVCQEVADWITEVDAAIKNYGRIEMPNLAVRVTIRDYLKNLKKRLFSLTDHNNMDNREKEIAIRCIKTFSLLQKSNPDIEITVPEIEQTIAIDALQRKILNPYVDDLAEILQSMPNQKRKWN